MFGATANPFAPASGGAGFFGTPAPVTRQPAGGGLFGASTSAPAGGATGGGLFGTAATPAPSLFGATPAPATSGAGLFGAAAALPASTGLFGAPAAGASLFGATPQASAAPAAGGGLFGAPAPTPAAGGYGAPAGGGLFGAAPASGGFFGAPPASGGLFGAPQPGAQQQPQQPSFSLTQPGVAGAPAGPVVSLETPFSLLPAEHRQFVEQLDQLIERTAEFNGGLLAVHGANADGALERIGERARDELASRVAHLASELGHDRALVGRFKAEVDELVSDARHADEAFERRAAFAVGAGDVGGSTFAVQFFARRGAAMRRQADELGGQLLKLEQLLTVSERRHGGGAETEFGYGAGRGGGAELGLGGGFGGGGRGGGGGGGEVLEVARVIREHQRLIESLTAHVASTHEQLDALRREHVRRLGGRDPFQEAEAAEQLAHKHRASGVPRARLAQWASNQASQQPPASGAAGAPQQPGATGAPSLFGAPAGGAQQPGAASAAAPSLFGGLAPPATSTTAPLSGFGGFGALGAPSASIAAQPSLFGAPSMTTSLSAPALGGGLFGGAAAPLAPQSSFGATQFGAAAVPQPNLRAKKKTTAARR